VTSALCGTRRDAMVARIIAAARAQLMQGEEVSIRGVAGRVGITAPALYRYVASREHLLDLVTAAIDIDIEAHIAATIEMQDKADPNSALAAALAAYRWWALANRAEFCLMVRHSGARSAGSRGREHLRSAKLVVELAATGRVPGSGNVDPGARARTHARLAQAFGVVCLEAFGHVDARLVECGALFEQVASQLTTTPPRS